MTSVPTSITVVEATVPICIVYGNPPPLLAASPPVPASVDEPPSAEIMTLSPIVIV